MEIYTPQWFRDNIFIPADPEVGKLLRSIKFRDPDTIDYKIECIWDTPLTYAATSPINDLRTFSRQYMLKVAHRAITYNLYLIKFPSSYTNLFSYICGFYTSQGYQNNIGPHGDNYDVWIPPDYNGCTVKYYRYPNGSINNDNMRKIVPLVLGMVLGIALMGLPGCGLIPKQVEFFQKKVEAVPTKSPKQIEKEKQSALYIDSKLSEAKDAALITGASTNVVAPISDAKLVSYALTTSLGPPTTPWNDSSSELSRLLLKEISTLNAKLDKYTDKVDKLEGKKIEGTGLIQVSYFTYVGGILVVILILYMALKIYGSVNPAVGVGLGLFEKISGSLAKKAVKQVVAGNEVFKNTIEEIVENADLRQKLLDEFRKSQTSSQDESIQNIIKLATSTIKK